MDPLLERRSLHSKTCRCAVRTCNNPIALRERLKDLLTLRFLQNVMKCPVYGGFRSGASFFRVSGFGKLQIGKIEVQQGPCRNNYGAFDYVLEFSYVSRPMISAQGIHRWRRNRFYELVHTSGELLREVPHQVWNIPFTLSQGWNLDGKDIESK